MGRNWRVNQQCVEIHEKKGKGRMRELYRRVGGDEKKGCVRELYRRVGAMKRRAACENCTGVLGAMGVLEEFEVPVAAQLNAHALY